MSTEQARSIVAEIRVPAKWVLLERALTAEPEMCIHGERFVPNDGDRMPFFWARNHDLLGFRAALENDPTVERVVDMEEFDDGALLHVEWDPPEPCVLDGLRTGSGTVTVLQAIGQEDEWFLKFRLSDREALSDVQTYCDERDIEFTLLQLIDLTAPKLGQYDITARQRDAMVTALEMGYFDVPRGVNLETVAEELDLSVNAVSERIRRGQANLCRSTLTIDRPEYRGLPAE